MRLRELLKFGTAFKTYYFIILDRVLRREHRFRFGGCHCFRCRRFGRSRLTLPSPVNVFLQLLRQSSLLGSFAPGFGHRLRCQRSPHCETVFLPVLFLVHPMRRQMPHRELSHLCPALEADHFVFLDRILWRECLRRQRFLCLGQLDLPRLGFLKFMECTENMSKGGCYVG